MAVTESTSVVDPKDLQQAMDFALDFFNRALKNNRIRNETYQDLVRYYHEQRQLLHGGYALDQMTLRPANVCWSCRGPVTPQVDYCSACGAPIRDERVGRLRNLIYVCFEIKKHEKAGRLPLSVAHGLLTEANERIAALRHNLDKDRAPLVAPAAAEPAPAAPAPQAGTPARAVPVLEPADEPEPARPSRARRETSRSGGPAARPAQRSLLEILLDPRSSQWLLSSGGVLLLLGLVIWLATKGLFEDPYVIACLMGAGNGVLLVGGWALILGTRYQGAGRALTLLACLVMPLNLWFYDAQGLITLQGPGHLWIPALVCCGLYAISARLLKDVLFVPVFVLGITATGLLLLADRDLLWVWDRYGLSAPAALLVVLGLLCIHVERIFPATDSPFSRKRFGLAFFWSGHAVLAAGLLLVLGAQLAGGFFYPMFEPLFKAADLEKPLIVTEDWSRLLALALVLAGTYAYLYSDLVVRRVGVYIYIAVFTLLWAEILLVNLFDWPIEKVEIVIIALSVTALLLNLLITSVPNEKAVLRRAGPPLAVFLSTVPVLIGVVLHFWSLYPRQVSWHYPITSSYVAAMAVTLISCRIGAFLYRHKSPAISFIYFFGTAAATLVGAAGLLVTTWPESKWEQRAPLLLVIPILYILAARLYRGHTAEKPLVWVAHAATVVMLVSCLRTAFSGFVLVKEADLNLMLALFFAEAALFYVLAASLHSQGGSVYLCTAMACAAVWQLLKYQGVADEYYTLAFGVVGLLLLIGYRLALVERYGNRPATAAFQCANMLLSLAFVGAALMTLNELLARRAEVKLLVPPLSILVGINLLAVFLVRHWGWRRWYVATAVANTALAVVVLAIRTNLSPVQKLELVCLVIGAGLLIASHLGWFREQDRHDDMVTLGLYFGSLLVGLPLTLTVLSLRIGQLVEVQPTVDTFHTLNEIGMLVVGLLLLSSGFVFKLRMTTVTGAIMVALYLVTLVLYIRLPEKLQATAVYLMIGGVCFFGLGLLLSIYRDRLLTLPERIKRREGIFRILSWR